MIRVGFIMAHTNSGWIGGVNYLRNLVHAIKSVSNGEVEPVMLVPPSTPDHLLEGFRQAEIIRTRLIDRACWWRPAAFRELIAKLVGRDILMERLLKRSSISLLSHSGHLGPHGRIPTISWLPDFQHLRLPEFFPKQEIDGRNREFKKVLKFSTSIVLSSYNAREDLKEFSPEFLQKARVLQFVSGDDRDVDYGGPERLVKKYGLEYPFFHLPNQFWVHKNHRVVIEALEVLKKSNRKVSVVSTGNIADWRRPDHYENLMKYAKEAGVDGMFNVLGVVPYDDLLALMRHSIAIINPSIFEGWSSTVEEGKSIGKMILLSNIGVHQEQMPERGVFFDPRDPSDLAEKMYAAMIAFSAEDESRYHEDARGKLQSRFAALGEKYISIVKEVIRD